MTIKSLIVGMGIGGLYKKVLSELDANIITVDPVASADYTSVYEALKDHKDFDTVHICTPNFTHEDIARQVASHTKILFIEKPGLPNETRWKKLLDDYPKTRILMVKNNMWRDNIKELQDLYAKSNNISFNWLNNNRVPKPGSWFTNKELAFGGVSRDLLPHLLSLFIAIEANYNSATWLYKHCWKKWNLNDLTDSDYGTIDPNGIYDVDDNVELEFTINSKRCFFKSSWRTLNPNDIGIHFDDTFIELGLCPEEAYKNMIVDCVKNIDNNDFWKNQANIDSWIHRKVNL